MLDLEDIVEIKVCRSGRRKYCALEKFFNRKKAVQVRNMLPQLPDNARYIHMPLASCALGLGMTSEVFRAAAVKKEEYRYFLFVNSAVRGPFLPTYAMVRHAQMLRHPTTAILLVTSCTATPVTCTFQRALAGR